MSKSKVAKKIEAEPSNQRLIAKFRQYYQEKEAEAKDYFCLLVLSERKKQLLLSGDEEAATEVHIALFQADLLLVGNGLCHEVSFLEEKDLMGRHEVCVLTL